MGTLDKMDHFSSGSQRAGVLSEPRPRRDERGQFSTQRTRSLGLGKQRDDQVLQRDHADAEMSKFSADRLRLVHRRGAIGKQPQRARPAM